MYNTQKVNNIKVLHELCFSIAITCRALEDPQNGIRRNCSGVKFENYNTVCEFSCNDGFNKQGSSKRICKDDGTWSGEDFYCKGAKS